MKLFLFFGNLKFCGLANSVIIVYKCPPLHLMSLCTYVVPYIAYRKNFFSYCVPYKCLYIHNSHPFP